MKGRFFTRDGHVVSEKVIAHDNVKGSVSSGTGTIYTDSYEVQEFFLAVDGDDKREHFRTEGAFRVDVGDPVRLVCYEFTGAAQVPDWIAKIDGEGQLCNGIKVVGFINLRTRRTHVNADAMPYATYFAMHHKKKIQPLLFWLGCLIAAVVSFRYGYETTAWITAGIGVVGLVTVFRQRLQLKRGVYADLFHDYCNLERRITEMTQALMEVPR